MQVFTWRLVYLEYFLSCISLELARKFSKIGFSLFLYFEHSMYVFDVRICLKNNVLELGNTCCSKTTTDASLLSSSSLCWANAISVWHYLLLAKWFDTMSTTFLLASTLLTILYVMKGSASQSLLCKQSLNSDLYTTSGRSFCIIQYVSQQE